MALNVDTRLLLQDASAQRAPGRITLAGFIQNSGGVGWPAFRTFGSYALVYVHAGTGVYADAQGNVRSISAGDCITVFPELPHRYGPARAGGAHGVKSTWCEFYLVFDGPVFQLWREAGILDPQNPVRRLEPMAYWLTRLVACADREVSPWKRLALLEQALVDMHEAARGGAAVSASAESAKWIEDAKRLLESDAGGGVGDEDMPAIARQLGVGYEVFRKRFTQLAGVPPARYRMERRIEEVSRMLLNANTTLRQIAERLGFCDEFHLSRCYRKVTGRSPAQFRSQAGSVRKEKRRGG